MIRVSVFYGYLASLLAAAAILQASPAWEAKTRRRVRLWRVYTSAGELIFALLTLALLVWWTYHSFALGSFKLGPGEVPQDLKQGGASIGHVLNLLLGLSILPVGKCSSLSSAFGLSWERATAYHRILGGVALVMVMVHVGLEISLWISKGTLVQNLFHYVTINWDQSVWPWIIPVMELLALSIVPAALATFPPVRRRCYNLFYRLHLVLPLLVVASFAHSWDFWQFGVVGLQLYLLDKLELAGMLLYGRRRTELLLVQAIGRDIVALTLRVSGQTTITPGQVMYLHIPSISTVQWHPFTAAWSDKSHAAAVSAGEAADCTIQHHIKASDSKATWTRALYDAASVHGQVPLRIQTIGPFGGVSHLVETASRQQLLVAGGVGVTPISALLGAFTEARSAAGDLEGSSGGVAAGLRLVWIARELELFVEYAETLEAVLRLPNARILLFLTAKSQPVPNTLLRDHVSDVESPSSAEGEMNALDALPASVRACLHFERPDLRCVVPDLILELLNSNVLHDPNRVQRESESAVSVFTCGPAPLELAVHSACCRFSNAEVELTSMNFSL